MTADPVWSGLAAARRGTAPAGRRDAVRPGPSLVVVGGGGQRESLRRPLPAASIAARPASSRATGTRNGEHET